MKLRPLFTQALALAAFGVAFTACNKPQPTPEPEPEPTPDPQDGSRKTFTVNGVSFVMIQVEGGTFQMGNDKDSDAPLHKVTLSNYYMAETEVTQELYQAVMGSNPSYFKAEGYPADNVTWDMWQAFITKLNELTGATFKVPTEAQWEYAARGGKLDAGYTYAGSNTIDEVACYAGNSELTQGFGPDGLMSSSRKVKSYKPNQLGLYDMTGNLTEFCADWYDKSYYTVSPEQDPTGPESGAGRVTRGGSWFLVGSYSYNTFRDQYKNLDTPSLHLGLRLAM